MSNEASENGSDRTGSLSFRSGAAIIAGAVVVALGAAYVLFVVVGDDIRSESTFTVKRGDLVIAVTASGGIEALESQEIRSHIKGNVKILSIVEEGFLVTPQDVEEGLVLVQLDSAELQDRRIDQEISYQSAQARLIEKRAEGDIQASRNQGNISAAKLTAKFALMDFEKFLGQDAVDSIVRELKLDEKDADLDEMAAISGVIDFASYADAEKLKDGEAKLRLRQLEEELRLAIEEHRLAKLQLVEYERHAEAGKITQSKLDLERLTVERQRSREESAKMGRHVYIQYTFQREAQRLLSDYEVALMNLKQTMHTAGAQMAQADVGLKSAERKFNLEARRLQEIAEQIEKCTIRAERPGRVVYGSSTEKNPWRAGKDERTQEGTTLRERQKIAVIPDITRMGVMVDVQESSVQKVAMGQTVTVSIDAFPDRALTGVVERVAGLADSGSPFMNPDLKVYPTTVRIDGVHGWLRPGMSAQVAILIESIEDVVYIPLQAVSYIGDDQVCYVVNNGKAERRVVTTGSFSEDFIEVRSGLEESEEVLLLATNTDE